MFTTIAKAKLYHLYCFFQAGMFLPWHFGNEHGTGTINATFVRLHAHTYIHMLLPLHSVSS